MNVDATQANEKVEALRAESKMLSVETGKARLLAIYSEIASLIDRQAEPKKWAAYRMMFGQLAYPGDLVGTLEAYRDALAQWDAVAESSYWAECNSYIGWCLFLLGRIQPPQNEEAIECLEASLAAFPDGTPEMLALLYQYRVQGDPWENWKKRIDYLQAAQLQVSVDVDPVHWAKLENEMGVALTHEPQGQFDQAVEQRIARHETALHTLQPLVEESNADANLSQRARNCLITVYQSISEAYLIRVKGEVANNREQAATYARAGRDSCDDATPRDTRSLATLAFIRALINEDTAPNREHALQALDLCQEVDGLLDRKEQAASTNEKFKALACLQLLKLGDSGRLAELLHHIDEALAMLGPNDSSDRRVLGQLAAEGLFFSDDFVTAIRYLEIAVEAFEVNLEEASSRSGRLERIFDMHESYSWLAYCYLRGNNLAEGLEALECGKARLWTREKPAVTMDQIRKLVPVSGALLFPVFSPKQGLVAIIADGGDRICPLPNLGGEHLKTMLVGDIANPQGDSWMARYSFKDVNPEAWRNKILSMGELLSDVLWSPVMVQLEDLGVHENAELVWFPQAGLGTLPLQAANSAKGYANRYAPSVRSVIGKSIPSAQPQMLLIADPPTPLRKLDCAALEVAWIEESKPAVQMNILSGTEASRERVLAMLPNTTIAHFCTHGIFETADPFRSRLILAKGEPLELEMLLPILKNSELREVVLSACETAVAPSWRFANEALGFPAALLSHGATTVIASQWPVDDLAAAALMGEFYRQWRTPPGKSPAQALHAAQRWLGDVSADTLYNQLDTFTDAPNPLGSVAAEMRTFLFAKDPEEKPFAHPYYWAAFTASGI